MPDHDKADANPSVAMMVDTFDGDCRHGRVIGSRTGGDVVRGGVDIEGVLSIDHDALRIAPLVEPDWGRSVLSYPPQRRVDGLLFAALVLNGHNTSQYEPLAEPFWSRLFRWLQGHGTRREMPRRALKWLRYCRKSYMGRRLHMWWRMAYRPADELNENLAVGWFSSDAEPPEVRGGNWFVMHAALGDNGELWARSHDALPAVLRGVQNLPMCYVVILRRQGAAYYLASVPGAHGAGTYPRFRPVAIDAMGDGAQVFPGIHQATLGQIGFRVDTRVYGVQAGPVAALDSWFGTAQVADRLSGSGDLEGSQAERGDRWEVVEGRFERTPDGLRSTDAHSTAVVRPCEVSGVVHVLAEADSTPGATVALLMRFRDLDHHYRLEVDDSECRFVLRNGRTVEILASTNTISSLRDRSNSIQIIVNGTSAGCVVNGEAMFGAPIALDHFDDATGVGLALSGASGFHVSKFEAHAAEVDLSDVVRFPAPWFELGSDVVVADDFAGASGQDLAGSRTVLGDKTWMRQYGRGRLLSTGSRAVTVDASVARPNPGNLSYLLDWDDPDFADISADITPPGTAIGQNERGRGGLTVWEDDDNFLMISMYLDDSYAGASIAIFSHLDGFEEIYDAVWSMVADKITWGIPHRLRVVCDGNRVMTLIDDEPVLYRALSDLYPDRRPLRINKVGLAANWEWGDDTGTTFADFVGRTRTAT